MDSDATIARAAQDTTPASPGRSGPPTTFLGAIAVVGASICIAVLLLVATGVSFWGTIGIPVTIVAALVLGVMHAFATIGRSLVGKITVGCGYLAVGAAILGSAAGTNTPLVPGPGLLAAAAFIGGAWTLLRAMRSSERSGP